MTQTCKTCKWHIREDSLSMRDYGAECTNHKLSEELGQPNNSARDMLIYCYNEGGGFWTGDDFGCIHHEQK